MYKPIICQKMPIFNEAKEPPWLHKANNSLCCKLKTNSGIDSYVFVNS